MHLPLVFPSSSSSYLLIPPGLVSAFGVWNLWGTPMVTQHGKNAMSLGTLDLPALFSCLWAPSS